MKNLEFGRNFGKIPILVGIFEAPDFGRDLHKISIMV